MVVLDLQGVGMEKCIQSIFDPNTIFGAKSIIRVPNANLDGIHKKVLLYININPPLTGFTNTAPAKKHVCLVDGFQPI